MLVRRLLDMLVAVGVGALATGPVCSTPAHLERASVSTTGVQGDFFSVRPEISGDGRAVAFISMSSNLATGVTMPGMSIYLRVPANQATTLVSANADGARANAPSVDPTFASRGRYVVFSSNATNLTSERTFGKKQIFRKDLVSKQVVLVSVDADGEAAAGDNAYASVSADGNIIAFTSYAALAPGCTATHVNIYVRDVARSKTTCLSVGSNGEEANDGSFQPSISADGSKVAFRSSANNLVSGDTNRVDDVFVRDMTTNTTTLVSVGVDGESANAESTEPSISGDGTRVAFTSNASNLVAGSNHHVEEIFVRDLAKGKTILASSRDGKTFADGTSVQPRLSLDGNTVVFMSAATNLTPQPTNGHRNIYALDLAKKQLRRISVATHGADLNGDCFQPAVSADGSIVAFRSNASNLVESDTNLTDDVFVQVALP